MRCPRSRRWPGGFLAPAHRIRRASLQHAKCRAKLPGSRERRASEVPAPSPLGATSPTQPRQPTGAAPELRRGSELGHGQCQAPQPPLGDGDQAPRGTQSTEGCSWVALEVLGVSLGSQDGGAKRQRGSATAASGAAGADDTESLPVRHRKGRAGSRQSLRRGVAGLGHFVALRYLLQLHLFQGVAVHVPLGVTGHLAPLQRLGGGSQPGSWKGSRRLSRGSAAGQGGLSAVSGGQQQPQGNRSSSVCVHGGRQGERETEAQSREDLALVPLPGSRPSIQGPDSPCRCPRCRRAPLTAGTPRRGAISGWVSPPTCSSRLRRGLRRWLAKTPARWGAPAVGPTAPAAPVGSRYRSHNANCHPRRRCPAPRTLPAQAHTGTAAMPALTR